ncbi:MAG TPA: DUF3048 domain-containing protein [Roseiflexaceae bacterium]|nr:DUF3048 domain-containing protein [Roseiflexaceae bacterium]HMP42139.1 DUF3048 domain-containing protein [Roseiflexaceae bacterium]
MLSPRHSRLVMVIVVSALVLASCGATAATPTALPAPTAVPEPTIAPTTVPQPTATAAPTTVPEPTMAPTAPPTPTPIVLQTSDPLTGAPALARGSLTRRPFVVMLDNHPNAYPQTGMNQAAIVFEALAEFGLTRFMAVYVPETLADDQQIGPVRSARLYFVQWAMGLQGLYAHAGGSPEALSLLAQTDEVVDLDALFRVGVNYYVRSSSRAAPHNLYTSGGALERAAAEFGADAPLASVAEVGFLFKNDAAEASRPASQRINYFFLYREDDVSWEYNPAINSYLRIRRTAPARDAVSGEQLQTKNLIVMEVFEAPIPGDDKGRIEQQVIGEGRARLYMDGVEREVIWRKSSADTQLSFFDPSGAEVQLNPGPVWLVALPSLDNLSVS